MLTPVIRTQYKLYMICCVIDSLEGMGSMTALGVISGHAHPKALLNECYAKHKGGL